jgi:acetoin utilization protein AcuB
MPSTTIAKVRDFMTACPITIEVDATLQQARQSMIETHARHLPVVHDGRLVGILSDRDVERTESLLVGEPRHRGAPTVREAMTEVVFTCGPDAHLHAVAAEMAERKVGSAVIVDRELPLRILGVFTTTDALAALSVFAPRETSV